MRRVVPLAVALALAAGGGCGSEDMPSRTADYEAPAAESTTNGDGWTNYVPLANHEGALLEGLTASTRRLDAAALADDALDRAALMGLLERARFVAGAENEYTGRTKLFSHVISRVLEFEGATGADAYLGWLDANASDLLGKIKSRRPLALGDGGAVFLEAGCGCHADVPTYLAAWRRGAMVHTVLADGPGVNRARLDELVRKHDRAYARST